MGAKSITLNTIPKLSGLKIKSCLMKHIRYGFDIEIAVTSPTTIITAFDVHPDRRDDLVDDFFDVIPPSRIENYRDNFGNLCRRIQAMPGTVTFRAEGKIVDPGSTDETAPHAIALQVSDLPPETLQFLLGSRYCETDLLGEFAWATFGQVKGGWAKVQAVCDFVHAQITFGYQYARATRTAFQAYQERIGVCRDFAHLAITLCRCLNIPARYCNGYLGDIGVPPDPTPMDFNAWFEVYLGSGLFVDGRQEGRWFTFDARHNIPRIGRIVVARGRDASDIPMFNTFGPHTLQHFTVLTEEV
jgi:transglutaminase-like putative cysteine protease